jgi:hypothetical protein
MNETDPRIAVLLDELLPVEAEPRKWEALLREAARESGGVQPTRRLRRHVALLATLATLAIMAPLAALGLARGCIFDSPYTPDPAGLVVTVASGHWSGTRWKLDAFRTTKNTLCYAVTVEPGSRSAPQVMESCTPIGASGGALSFMRSDGAGRGAGRPGIAAYIVGSAPESARSVEVIAASGASQRIATVSAPKALGVPRRLFIARRSATADVERIVALDSAARPIETLEVGSPRSQTYQLASGGRALKLSREAVNELRRHHRSTKIALLASQSGQSFYRLGTTGRCYGVGKSSNMRWQPADRVMQIIGSVICGARTAFPSAEAPVLDLSVYGQARGSNLMSVKRVSGIASDAIGAVGLVSADGLIVRRVPVVNGVFAPADVPAGVVSLAPMTRSGLWLRGCGFGARSVPVICRIR